MPLARRSTLNSREEKLVRTTALCTVAALVVIYLIVRVVVAPWALRANGHADAADITHPPTSIGASAVVPLPHLSTAETHR